MASYTSKDKFTLGVNANTKLFAGIEEINAMCFSVLGSVFIMPKKLKALVRYDIAVNSIFVHLHFKL